jgi:glycosyltransferase involved in cell wall biosynthesis
VIEGETGSVVRVGDAEGLAERLVEFLTDDELRASCARGIADLRDGALSWVGIARQLVHIYGDLRAPTREGIRRAE